MYLDHYHLNTKPFDLSPRPQFLWLGEKHKEALSTLKYGISGDLGFLLLTGDVGVGKTALIHRLASNLDASTIVAHITDPGLGTFDFFKVLAAEFKIPDEFHSKGEFLIELEKFLKNAYADQKKVLLIVDEAQRLSNKLLDQIRVLSNIELSDRKLINIFFVGQPEFKTMLMATSSRAIRQRIAINYHIAPLTESETGQYIQHRLKVAGATRKIFKSNAIPEIFRVTNGSPRAINILCDHALVTGYAAGLPSIDSGMIKECEQELSIRAGFDFNKSHLHTPTAAAMAEMSTTASRRSAFKGYHLLLGLGFVLVALLSVYLLRTPPVRKLQAETPIQIREAGNVAEKEQAQAFPETEIATASPGVEDITRDQTGPLEKMVAADRQPLKVITPPSPAPAPLPADSAPGTDMTTAGETEQMVAGPPDPPAAKTEPPPEQVAWNEFNRQSATSTNEETPGTDRQPAAADNGPAEAEPGPSTTLQDGGNDATPRGKPTDTPVLATLADAQSGPPTSRDTIDAQKAPPVGKEPVEADRQLPEPTSEAGPNSVPSTGNREVDNDAAATGKTGKEAPVAVAVAVVKPDTPVKTVASVASGTEASVETATIPENTADSISAETKSNTTDSPTRSTTEKTPIKQKSDEPSPARQNTPPEKENKAEPSLSAKAAAGLSSNSEKSGGTAASVAQSVASNRENRLRKFLQTYCNTYAAKDLDTFSSFFAANAMENGKPFDSLLPKYERNFKFIETIQYRIELQQFSYNDEKRIVEIEGNFFLKWLPPDKTWRENSGKIFMNLKENGPTFLVQLLEYHGQRPPKK